MTAIECVRAAVLSGAALTGASCALATGPSAQQAPWRPAAAQANFSTINSVVQVTHPFLNRVGSGTIFAKRTTMEGNQRIGWLCVLTADHVAWPNDAVFNSPTFLSVGLGDNAAQGSLGGAETVRFRAALPVAQGGLNKPVDVAVLGVRYGVVDDKFERITPIDIVTRSANQLADRNLTQVGYGGTGAFVDQVAGAGGNPAGMRYGLPDGKKRFQNNRVAEVLDSYSYTSSINNVAYTFPAVRFDFDRPVAPANNYQNLNLLVGEGASFPGDSGGPLFDSALSAQSVSTFNRPGAGSDWAPPGGSAEMPLLTNGQFAVMAAGPSVTEGGVTAYGSKFYGVNITGELSTWIGERADAIPSPSSLPVLVLMGAMVGRRRRV
jgi:uncharacterized protein (TIGR03382 family)